VNAVPGRDDGDGCEESGQDDEEDAEAVDAEVVVDGRRADPVEIFLELIAGEAEVHFAQEQQWRRRIRKWRRRGEAFDEFVIVATEDEEGEGADGRDDDEAREQAGKHHSAPPARARRAGQKTMMRMAAPPRRPRRRNCACCRIECGA